MKTLALLFLLIPTFAFGAMSSISPKDVTEIDGNMDAFIKILSGSPVVVVVGHGPNNSDAITLGTLQSGTPRITWVGPMETIEIPTITGSGQAEVSFCGRVPSQ